MQTSTQFVLFEPSHSISPFLIKWQWKHLSVYLPQFHPFEPLDKWSPFLSRDYENFYPYIYLSFTFSNPSMNYLPLISRDKENITHLHFFESIHALSPLFITWHWKQSSVYLPQFHFLRLHFLLSLAQRVISLVTCFIYSSSDYKKYRYRHELTVCH